MNGPLIYALSMVRVGCSKVIVECEQYYALMENIEAYEIIGDTANVTVMESRMIACLCLPCRNKQLSE